MTVVFVMAIVGLLAAAVTSGVVGVAFYRRGHQAGIQVGVVSTLGQVEALLRDEADDADGDNLFAATCGEAEALQEVADIVAEMMRQQVRTGEMSLSAAKEAVRGR